MSDGGKGSRPRPYSVDTKTFNNNWEAIFGKKSVPTPQSNDQITDMKEQPNESQYISSRKS